MPDLEVSESGGIQSSEWKRMENYIFNNIAPSDSGTHTVKTDCDDSVDEDKVKDFVENWNEKYDPSIWAANTCKGFAWKAIEAGRR